jgi:hypothetical protein
MLFYLCLLNASSQNVYRKQHTKQAPEAAHRLPLPASHNVRLVIKYRLRL